MYCCFLDTLYVYRHLCINKVFSLFPLLLVMFDLTKELGQV